MPPTQLESLTRASDDGNDASRKLSDAGNAANGEHPTYAQQCADVLKPDVVPHIELIKDAPRDLQQEWQQARNEYLQQTLYNLLPATLDQSGPNDARQL